MASQGKATARRKELVRRRKELRKWWKGRRRGVQQRRKSLRSWQKTRRPWRRTFWLVALALVTRTGNGRDRLLRAKFEPELEELGRRLPWRR
jgi:hypothetical protein